MKKSLLFAVLIFIGIILLATTLIYHIVYFKNFNEKVRPISDSEKIIIIEVLKNNSIPSDDRIKFGNVFIARDKEIAQIELTSGESKKDYFIDLRERKLVKK